MLQYRKLIYQDANFSKSLDIFNVKDPSLTIPKPAFFLLRQFIQASLKYL